MTPTFYCKNVFETGWGKVFGNNHLKLELFQKSNPNIRFQAIAYDKGDYINFFQRKILIDLIKFRYKNNGKLIKVLLQTCLKSVNNLNAQIKCK